MKQINKYRRKITKKLTQGIKQSPENTQLEKTPEQIKKVLICRPNHRLGNQLLISPLVEEVIESFPNANISLFVKGGISFVLFKNCSQIKHIIALPKKHFKKPGAYLLAWFRLKKTKYDLVINCTPGSSSGRLSIKIARSSCKVFGDEQEENLKNILIIYI